MKYTYEPKGGIRKVYKPTWTILSGPDMNGTCKCYDETINVTVFLNISELKPIL